MVVDLSAGQVERQPPAREAVYLGIGLPLIVLDPFQASAAAKLRLLAKVGPRSIMRAP